MRRALTLAGFLAGFVGLAALLVTAGWHFWPNGAATQIATPSAGRAGAALPDDSEVWLISPTGGPVASMDVHDYLMQDRPTTNRALTLTLLAPLADLLAEGEDLPDPIYLEIMADVRAPILAEGLCPVLVAGLAERCSVAIAKVEKGSIDALRGTAIFQLKLRFSLATDPDDLPDLARHVLETRIVELAPAGEGGMPASVELALQSLLMTAEAACSAEDAGQACRVLRLSLDYAPGRPARGRAVIGSLYPLPETIRTAPELIPAPRT